MLSEVMRLLKKTKNDGTVWKAVESEVNPLGLGGTEDYGSA